MSEHTWKTVLDVIEEELGAKDKRIAELERELASANELNRRAVDNAADFALKLVAAQRELAERPVVESEAARKLRERLRSPFALPFVSPTDWATLDYKRTAEILREFRDSAPPTIAPIEGERVRLLTEQLNAQAKSHAEEGERWSREMGELKCELEALKAAPARVEREVDRELADAWPGWDNQPDKDLTWYSPGTQRLILAGRAWLAAPLSAAPAQDELTKAAVEYIEASFDCPYDERRWNAAWDRCRAIYDARKRGDASAARTNVPVAQSEEHAGSNGVVAGSSPAGDTNQASADHLRDAAKKVEPAPAEERVMVYAKLRPDGTASPAIWSELDRRNEGTLDGEKWLALTAAVVREGGGEKGGAS